jgi:hypothetical protein
MHGAVAVMPLSLGGIFSTIHSGRPDRLSNRQGEERSHIMAESKVTVWFDPEGDYLEVIFDKKPGYFRETTNDQVMEKVDQQGNILGFSVLKVSALKKKPLEVSL